MVWRIWWLQFVYDFEWINDFSAARNYSFSKATKDYQMWLDADDIITEENKEKILNLKEILDSSFDIVTFKYNTHFDKDNNPILTSTRYTDRWKLNLFYISSIKTYLCMYSS